MQDPPTIPLDPGTQIKVTYLDHQGTLELSKSVPEISEALGRFVKFDVTKEGCTFMVLSMDWNGDEPVFPFSVILWRNVLKISRMTEDEVLFTAQESGNDVAK